MAINLPDVNSRKFTEPGNSVQAMTTATAYTPGKYLLVSCTSAGAGVFTFNDGTTVTLSFPVGVFIFPLSVTTYTASSGTMTCNIVY